MARLTDSLCTATGSTTSRTIGDRFADVVNVKDFGAKGDGTTDDTAAIATAAAKCGQNLNGTLYFPRGTYRTDTITVPSWVSLVGDGWINTRLRPTNNDNDLLYLDRASGTSSGYQNEIRGLMLWGYATGTGAGIYGTGNDGAAIGVSGLRIRDVYVDGFGGNGIHLETPWNTTLENVQATNSLGHQFYIGHAFNSVALYNCYARNTPTAGMAGFRVMEGHITFVNCNGVDADGDYWGVFGGEVADGDPGASNVQAMIVGCNIEAAEVAGLWIKRNSSAEIYNSQFIAHSNGTSKAVYYHNFNNSTPVFWSVTNTASGTWANGYAFHASLPPGVITVGAGAFVSVWNETSGFSNQAVRIGATETVTGDIQFPAGVMLGGSTGPRLLLGSGAPSGDAPVGSLYFRTDGGAGSSLYVKEAAGAGGGNWAAK